MRTPRWRRAGLRREVSSPGELHSEALPERCVNLSIHTAPIIQSLSRPHASGRKYVERPSSSCATTGHSITRTTHARRACSPPPHPPPPPSFFLPPPLLTAGRKLVNRRLYRLLS